MSIADHQNMGAAGRAMLARRPAACLSEQAFTRYLQALDDLVDGNGSQVPERVAVELRQLVEQGGWLPRSCCEPGGDSYRRHLLYADPTGRFTVLAVVWQPGQGTPVHGHTAWGAVGVYQGHPSVTTYRCTDGSPPALTGEHQCKPGDVCHVTPGTAEPHRVFNASDAMAITIHTYGRDLSVDPAAINIVLEDAPH
jgi:predicted metal-dependent enzyme (double-stranded beta helix superfamily)